MEDSKRKGNLILGHVIRRIAVFIPSHTIILPEIPLGVAVGPDFRPEDVMVTFPHGVQEAGQADEGEIEPPKTLAVGGVPELMLAYLVAKDIPLPFALHPWRSPQVDEGPQRHPHAIFKALPGSEGDTAKGINAIDLPYQSAGHRIKPPHQGLWQLPCETGEQLPDLTKERAFRVGQEKTKSELGDEFKTMHHGL